MTLDRTLAKEINGLNGDRSRDAKFALLAKIDAAAKDMSNPNIAGSFDKMLGKHGRAVVAICVASTLWTNKERLDNWQIKWAMQVLDEWKLKPMSGVERAVINDGLHPTRICEYAGAFINFTSEN